MNEKYRVSDRRTTDLNGRRRIHRFRVRFLIAAAVVFMGSPMVAAAQPAGLPAVKPAGAPQFHEPIFGVGPRTIWKNGIGFEIGLDRDKSKREESWGVKYGASYGITPNWAISTEVQQVVNQTFDESGLPNTGLGDLMIGSKYRFYRKFFPGGLYHAAVLGGVELPTGAAGLSSESTDVFGGLTAGYEGRRWLVFSAGRYRINTVGTNDIKRGNVFLMDFALGIRPMMTGYYQPDLVLMAEVNGQIFGDREVGGSAIEGSSGERLLAGFGAWVTHRNWAFKPGVQVPVYNNLSEGDLDYRFVLSVEVHF